MIRRFLFLFVLLLCCSTLRAQKQMIPNPITGGYFADPTIVKDKGRYFIYATIDPWGSKELAVLETTDFVKFTRHHINWPTKQACTSKTSLDEMVWAPSVVKGKDNKFYMYVAVGGEVWGGVSNTPLGPWKNLKKDNSPMVKSTDYPNVHNIDPDCFIDTDGSVYLYWGSGYHWINGHCMAVKLKSDMVSFNGAPKDITTPHFFEGAHIVKRKQTYYLMFSEGKAIDASYQVGYAKGKNPLGPFKENEHRVILSTSSDSTVIGPGHHTTFLNKGQRYILYHRIFPQKESFVLRQLCLDSLNFDNNGDIKKVSIKSVEKFN